MSFCEADIFLQLHLNWLLNGACVELSIDWLSGKRILLIMSILSILSFFRLLA